MTAVRVPASSANLGAGFDVFGMALTLYADVGCGAPPNGATVADEHHPAMVAFRRLGGHGELWVQSSIPMGRGLGYSGAVRVGGAAAAVLQRERVLTDTGRQEILAASADLEHHADNAGASLFGGVVAAVAEDHEFRVTSLPLGFASMPAVVAWVPDATTTSTDRSRATLPTDVALADAVFNIGRAVTFAAGLAAGDIEAVRLGTGDRLHQQWRLARVPESAAALDAALSAGAWSAWLSGSGPTIAALCAQGDAGGLAAALPNTGHTKILGIDPVGVTVID
ncbi:MAG TPA: hypothetical protein VMM60_01515 [Ilumatobacter sp.]|nr:hypothetical protein [Ilumatobacter sp.]